MHRTIIADPKAAHTWLKDIDLWPGDTVTVLSPLKATKLESLELKVDRDGKLREVE